MEIDYRVGTGYAALQLSDQNYVKDRFNTNSTSAWGFDVVAEFWDLPNPNSTYPESVVLEWYRLFSYVWYPVRHTTEVLVSTIPKLTDRYETALVTLENIEEDLDEDDIRPSDSLIEEVKGLVHRLYAEMDFSLDIHAMPEGDIVLNVSPQRRDMIFIHCDADGSAYCMTKLGNVRSTRSYDSISSLPDEFIRQALNQLRTSSE